jgi:hypothetical protein
VGAATSVVAAGASAVAPASGIVVDGDVSLAFVASVELSMGAPESEDGAAAS